VDPVGSPYEQHGGSIIGNRDPYRHCTENRTIGWEPTCRCHENNGSPVTGHDPRPCLVLDPFGGSGTVGMVAAQERRDWLLIEAKEEYCRMSQRRTDGVMKLPLFPSEKSR
jgi:hypothetical protein